MEYSLTELNVHSYGCSIGVPIQVKEVRLVALRRVL